MLTVKRLDHILISVPPNTREAARTFYGEVLQWEEIPGNHPRGAIWFRTGDIELHIREEASHNDSSDRHAAFEVENLDEVKRFLTAQQVDIAYSTPINGRDRCFFRDPWGNRFELLAYAGL